MSSRFARHCWYYSGVDSIRFSTEDILRAYPYLEPENLQAALTYAAWAVEEIEVSLESSGGDAWGWC